MVLSMAKCRAKVVLGEVDQRGTRTAVNGHYR
jgi:hypothetical protein